MRRKVVSVTGFLCPLHYAIGEACSLSIRRVIVWAALFVLWLIEEFFKPPANPPYFGGFKRFWGTPPIPPAGETSCTSFSYMSLPDLIGQSRERTGDTLLHIEHAVEVNENIIPTPCIPHSWGIIYLRWGTPPIPPAGRILHLSLVCHSERSEESRRDP